MLVDPVVLRDLELDLRLEAVMEGVLVSGTARGRAVGECVRCLEAMSEDVEVDVQELFVYPDKARVRDETDPASDEKDEYELDGDLIDVEPVLRDAVVLALPFQPVCTPDCPGLCSECGARLADDPVGVPRCDCGHPLKPDVVLFGEFLPMDAMGRAEELSQRADLLLCVGSSLEVYPVAGLPSVCLRAGGAIAIVSQGPTKYDAAAAVRLSGDVVAELEGVVAAL